MFKCIFGIVHTVTLKLHALVVSGCTCGQAKHIVSVLYTAEQT